MEMMEQRIHSDHLYLFRFIVTGTQPFPWRMRIIS